MSEKSNVPICDCGEEMRYSLSSGEFYCLKCIYQELQEKVYNSPDDDEDKEWEGEIVCS